MSGAKAEPMDLDQVPVRLLEQVSARALKALLAQCPTFKNHEEADGPARNARAVLILLANAVEPLKYSVIQFNLGGDGEAQASAICASTNQFTKNHLKVKLDVGGLEIEVYPSCVIDDRVNGSPADPAIVAYWQDARKKRGPAIREVLRTKAACAPIEDATHLSTSESTSDPTLRSGASPPIGPGKTKSDRIPAANNEGGNLCDSAHACGIGVNDSITRLTTKLSHPLDAIGGLILLWHASPKSGLRAADVLVEPAWKASEVMAEGLPTSLEGIPTPILSAASPYLLPVHGNRPKVWIRQFADPLSDQGITLKIGGLDREQELALGKAYESPILFQGRSYQGLVELYENDLLHLRDNLYGVVAVAVTLLTSDGYLILGQPSPSTVHVAPSAFSPSYEEGWNPSVDTTPDGVVVRGLHEEWGLRVAGDGTQVDVRLVAVGREWHPFWHTSLLYLARTTCSAVELLAAQRGAQDRYEHRAVGAVPIHDRLNRKTLVQAVRAGSLDPSLLVGAVWGGSDRPRPAPFHPTTGAARILYALASTCSQCDLLAEAHSLAT